MRFPEKLLLAVPPFTLRTTVEVTPTLSCALQVTVKFVLFGPEEGLMFTPETVGLVVSAVGVGVGAGAGALMLTVPNSCRLVYLPVRSVA